MSASLFSFEVLEDRLLLAGNVVVSMSGASSDILEIEGDVASNKIEIVSDGTTITVTGKGTQINGSNDPFIVNVVDVAEIDIDMKDGHDQVTMIAANQLGNGFGIESLNIETGAGNDKVSIYARNAGGVGFAISGDLDINTADGNDKVTLITENESGMGIVCENSSINTYFGNDQVKIIAKNESGTGLFVSGSPPPMPGGPGAGVGRLSINTGEGNDRVTLSLENGGGTGIEIGTVIAPSGQLAIDSGNGNDKVTIQAKNSEGTGMAIRGQFGATIDVLTRDGKDSVTLKQRGEGNVVLSSSNSVVRLDGGDGTKDKLLNTLFTTPTILGFEKVKP